MDKEGIKVGLFGATHPHSDLHARTLAASNWVEKVVVYDDEEEAARSLVDTLGNGFTWEKDINALIRNGGLQVGITNFTTDKNAELCCLLLDHGVHVLSEKPAGLSASEIQEIIERARANRLHFGVMYQSRFHPIVRQVRQLIQKGYLGEITGCEGRLITSQVRYRDPAHWLFQKDKAGGGILSWLGCHFLDLFLYLVQRRVDTISSMVGTLGGEAIDVEDVAAVLLKFEGGAIGSLHTGYQLPLSSGGFVYPNYESYLAFRGTLGRAWWSPFEEPLRLHVESRHPDWAAAPSRQFSYELPKIDTYGGAYGLEFFNSFFHATQQETGAPPATGEDALKIARIVEAAYASSRSGAIQKVDTAVSSEP